MAIKVNNSISIVFPAFNEEENIESAISQAVNFLGDVFVDYEVIVVNDGSSDRTGEIVDHISQDNPKVKAVHHKTNTGYGRALTSGFENATMDLVFFCDSDLQFHLYEILPLLSWIENHDIVIGYRAQRVDPWYRRLNAYGWRILVRLLLGLKVNDIDCAFKMFRREIFNYVKIDAVGAMVNTDILVQAQKFGFKIKELPVTHFPRTSGQQTGANLRVIIKAFGELFRLYGKLKNIKPIVVDHDERVDALPDPEAKKRLRDGRYRVLPISFSDRRRRIFLEGPGMGMGMVTLQQAGQRIRSDSQIGVGSFCDLPDYSFYGLPN